MNTIDNSSNDTSTRIYEIATRIRELREISGFSVEQIAKAADMTPEQYLEHESGSLDLPFTFIHKCAQAFDVEIIDLLEGKSAYLKSYTVTRSGGGQITAKEPGILIKNMAPLFHDKIAEPYWVQYAYNPALQKQPIRTTTHGGQEFDLVIKGKLKVRVGEHTEVLAEGDSIYYDSSTPHGMIAIDGQDCVFCAVILPGAEPLAERPAETITAVRHTEPLVYRNFVQPVEDENGALQSISFKNKKKFNFAFDIVDELAKTKPDKLAMLHVNRDKVERRFSFEDISRNSARAANYFKSLGIEKGDRVMLVLRRNYQFWFILMGLHKLGAVAVPVTDQLLAHDFAYRYRVAGVKGIICTADSEAWRETAQAMEDYEDLKIKIMVNGAQAGWHDFDEEYQMFRSSFERTKESPRGDDPMLMYFSSGTTGYPKLVTHSHTYPLGHFVTAKYWQCVDPDGLHLTISETGWLKSLWGKLYGQWLNEAAVFVYDFDRFDAHDILPMFAQYQITTFCAPPTMYRFLIKEDLSKYDLSSIKHATTAGEALNPEVFHQFKKATGLSVMEGFGQTETTLSIANLVGMTPRIGSMGKPNPLYQVELMDSEGYLVKQGENGEIVIRTAEGAPCGLFTGYYGEKEQTDSMWHDGYYHTGDTAWRDEDGYFWYVGRTDDLIKSSGYRIGPFEIESVIMELPYVLECGVCGAPDETRGQVVKACVVLTKETQGSDKLKKEIQDYVKKRTAPYKYPRIVEFRDALPKTISGKIIRKQL